MKLHTRVGAVAAGALFALVIGVGSMAWACTPQLGLAPLAVRAGTPGTTLAVTGQATQRGPVEIRWNGVKGPVIGAAVADQGRHGTDFSATVTIPQADPGVYYLMLVAGNGAMGRAAFQVTAPLGAVAGKSEAASAPAAHPWRAFDASQAPREVPVGSSSGFGGGLVLLAVGSVVLVAGAAAAGLRRNRVVAADPIEGRL